MILFLSFFPFVCVLLFLWVPEKILSLFDCGLSQEGTLALGRKGLFPLSRNCLSVHLSICPSIPTFHSVPPTHPSSQVLCARCRAPSERVQHGPAEAEPAPVQARVPSQGSESRQSSGGTHGLPSARGSGGASTGLPGPLVTCLLCPWGFLRAPA